jgi:hypothetical protein
MNDDPTPAARRPGAASAPRRRPRAPVPVGLLVGLSASGALRPSTTIGA